jgi:hypothetical protein
MKKNLSARLIELSALSILLVGCGSVDSSSSSSTTTSDEIESTNIETEETEISTSVPSQTLVYDKVDVTGTHGVLKDDREDPGIYDAETGELLISYDEMVEKYNFGIDVDYTRDTPGLKTILDKAKITQDIKFVLPETDTIGSNVAVDSLNLVAIDIAYGTTIIGDYAFSDTGLTEVELPSTVTEINNGAFATCYDLTSVDLGGRTKYIGMQAFSNDKALTQIELPDTLEMIDNAAFNNVPFDYVNIPDSTTVGSYAFYGTNTICYNGSSIDKNSYSIDNTSAIDLFGANTNHSFNGSNTCELCGDTVEYVDYVIKRPEFIDHTTGICDIPLTFEEKGVTYKVIGIANGAYNGCEDIKVVQMKESVISIDKYAFSECSNLETVALSENLKYIGDGAFSYCPKLTEIYIPSSVPTLYSAFEGCSNLRSVTVPSGVTFDYHSFTGCTSLEEINYGGTKSEWESQIIGAPAPAMQVDIETMLQDASPNLKIKYNQTY